jgi:hypothetical protein
MINWTTESLITEERRAYRTTHPASDWDVNMNYNHVRISQESLFQILFQNSVKNLPEETEKNFERSVDPVLSLVSEYVPLEKNM